MANGVWKATKDMAEEYKSGLMAADMKATGRRIRLM